MGRISRGLLTLVAVLTLVLSWPDTGSGAKNTGQREGHEAKAVLELLKQLQGTWRGEGGVIGGELTQAMHEFSVAAGGSIVVEIMDPEGERELNVYHLVNDELLLTHFCGGANQPVLKLDTSRAEQDILLFVLAGGTNFNPASDRHIHTSRLVLRGKSNIESRWTAEKAGTQVMESRFVFERVVEP